MVLTTKFLCTINNNFSTNLKLIIMWTKNVRFGNNNRRHANWICIVVLQHPPSFKDGDMLTRKLTTQFLHPCILRLEHFFFYSVSMIRELVTHTHTNYWYSRHEKLIQIQLLIQHTTSPLLLIVIVSLNFFNHNAMPSAVELGMFD